MNIVLDIVKLLNSRKNLENEIVNKWVKKFLFRVLKLNWLERKF